MNEKNCQIPVEDLPKIRGLLQEFLPHKSAVYSLAVTSDQKYVITGSYDKTAKIWELNSGEIINTLRGHKKEITSVNISSDSGRIVTASEDKTVKLWKLDSGNLMRNFTGHEGAVFGALISPNDKYVISISEDKTARIWDWNTKKTFRILKSHKHGLNSVAITPDGKKIVTCDEKIIHIWDWGSTEPILSIEGHKFSIRSIDICPKGEFFVSASYDKTIKIWDLETGSLIRTLEGHKGSINSVTISHDRKYIASASGDKTLFIWDFNGKKKYGPFPHDNFVQCVKFIPNTHLVITGDYNGKIRVWDCLDECIDFKSALNVKECIADVSDKSVNDLNVFISYASVDSDMFAIPRVAKLLNNSFPNIDSVLYWEENMDDDIYVYMNDNLAIADIVVVFCSEMANQSEAVRTEWMAAHKMKKKIIPVFKKEEDIPPLLTTKLGIQFNPNDLKGFVQNLHSMIQKKFK